MQQSSNTTPLPSHIHLQAVDHARNIARDYAIHSQPDLFGHWIVDLHWGRIGTRGQARKLSFAVEQDAARFIRSTLTRRASAKRRIGVGYVSCPLSAGSALSGHQQAASP